MKEWNVFIAVLVFLFNFQVAFAFRMKPTFSSMTKSAISLQMKNSDSSDTAPITTKTAIATAMRKAVRGKSFLKVKATGVGSCAGKTTMPNSAFESLVDTNDAWITKRTGIHNRHILQPGTRLREIAVEAAVSALAQAKVSADEIDLVIVATCSPDDLFGDAAFVASQIGASKAASFDLTAACSGFLYGMVTGSQYIQAGAYKKVLVIGADALTRFLDWKDRGTCILFGDGAGAVVLEATDKKQDSGILGFALHSDGVRYPNLHIKYESNFVALENDQKSVVDTGGYGKIGMNGPEVYKFAVNEVSHIAIVLFGSQTQSHIFSTTTTWFEPQVPAVVKEALDNAGLRPSDVDWLLLHQANERIMDHAAKELGIDRDKVLKNLEEYGNTSAGRTACDLCMCAILLLCVLYPGTALCCACHTVLCITSLYICRLHPAVSGGGGAVGQGEEGGHSRHGGLRRGPQLGRRHRQVGIEASTVYAAAGMFSLFR